VASGRLSIDMRQLTVMNISCVWSFPLGASTLWRWNGSGGPVQRSGPSRPGAADGWQLYSYML